MIKNDDGNQELISKWKFDSLDEVIFVSEEQIVNYIGQLLKINKDNILEPSGSDFDPKNSKVGLVDDTMTGFEKFAESIGVEMIKEDKDGFNPFEFLKD